MKRQGDIYLERLTKASLKKDPLTMAIITYQAFRDSDMARILNDIDKASYDAEAWDSIVRMAHILEKLGWEEDQIQEFLKKSKELAGIDDEK